ncbi:MAG: iron-sulfur cluster insertion protein ErpA [Anaerolineaceae bacterium]|nr:iron-sulfur cluster insertion protein ErpA [Anaerolineaceae bacterium]
MDVAGRVDTDIKIETPILNVTMEAVNIINTLLKQREIPNHALRVFVSGGGCSGMQYGMSFEETAKDYDTVIEVEGVRLLIDPTSLMYLRGATIDYVDSLMGGGFRIDNPNAVSTCGCGHSFRTDDSEDAGSGCGGGCSH